MRNLGTQEQPLKHLGYSDLKEAFDIIQIERELCSRHLIDFIPAAWHVLEPGTVYKPNWHIDAICEHLEAITRGELRFLVINMPPRTMKSLSVSVCWQVWDWIKRPWTRWIFASYGQHLSTRDTVKARRIIQSPWYQQRWGDKYQLAGDVNLKTHFENTHMGFRIATSPDGIATGEGGHIQVIDDPHNVKEAESDAVREGTLQWLTEVMPTRFNDQTTGAQVIVQQRVHDRDCAGLMLREHGYEHLCLPMRYERSRLVPQLPDGTPNKDYVPPTSLNWSDPRTEEGELLWESHMPIEAVDRVEGVLGPYATAGQFQQRPTPRGGGMFKRANLPVVDKMPTEDEDGKPLVYRMVRSWDWAATDPEKQTSLTDPDWTCGVLGAMPLGDPDPDFYIVHVIRFRLDPGERDDMVLTIAKEDGTEVIIWIEQEPGASGKSSIVQARKLLSGYAVNPPRIDPMPASIGTKTKNAVKEAGVPTGNKVTRAEPLATHAHRRKVFILRGEWNSVYLDEMTTFPLSAKKDQVDATSQCFMRLMEKPPSVAELMREMGYYGR